MRLIIFILLSTIAFNSAYAQYHIKTVKVDSNIYLYTSYGDVGDYKNIDANAVVVVSGNDALIFDTPWDNVQATQLITWITDSLHKNIKAAIITHAHVDRIGSIEVFHQYGIPTYSYKLTAIEAKKNKHPLPKHLIQSNDTTFSLNDIDVVAYYPGEGHTVDNMVLYIPSKEFLYGGCFIKSGLSKSIGNIADANTTAWPVSIRNMQHRFLPIGIKTVIPGHGSWDSNKAIENTLYLLDHLKE